MIVYLGLGSNQGDRVGAIQQALRLLSDHEEIRLLSASSFYETEPVEFKDQEWFVNAAIAIDTTLPPEALLEFCQEVEKRLGRVRHARQPKGPRTIDIDILFYGNLVMNEPDLVIPHLQLHHRACVLVPMLEVNSRMMHPVLKRNIEQLHTDLEEPEEVLLYGTRRVTRLD
jgi:2-amino-4-hydroxy-6-hydroxymethyldihydropteridine diphosphokinase